MQINNIDQERIRKMEPEIPEQKLSRILKALEMGLIVVSEVKKKVKIEVTPKGKFIEKELIKFIDVK